jgi:hypothetical protein
MPGFIAPPSRNPAAKAGVAAANASDRAVTFKNPSFDIAFLREDQNQNIARKENVVGNRPRSIPNAGKDCCSARNAP